MHKFEDENLIVGYILGALEEAEETEFSQRLAREQEFCDFYKRTLASLRQFLRSRNDLDWDKQARMEARGLAERTLQRLKENAEIASETPSEITSNLAYQMFSETALGALQETCTSQPKRIYSSENDVEEVRN